MHWKRAIRRLGHWLTLGQLQYCRRCQKWQIARNFTYLDKENVRSHHRICAGCRIVLPPRLESLHGPDAPSEL